MPRVAPTTDKPVSEVSVFCIRRRAHATKAAGGACAAAGSGDGHAEEHEWELAQRPPWSWLSHGTCEREDRESVRGRN